MRPAPPHLPQIRRLPSGQRIGVGFRLVEQRRHRGVGQAFVPHPAKQRELAGTRRHPAGRHERRGIPIEHADNVPKDRQFVEQRLETLVGGIGRIGHSLYPAGRHRG
jgi:hypothetical protein